MKTGIRVFLLLPIIAIGLSSCGDREQEGSPGFLSNGSSGRTQTPQPGFARLSGDYSLSDIAEQSVHSVVNVSSIRKVQPSRKSGISLDDPFLHRYFGPKVQSEPPLQQGVGSGVVVSNDGLVVTNYHVIAGANVLLVTLPGGRDFEVSLIGADPPTDIAVLRLKGKHGELHPLPLGNSDNLRLGEVVLAIGNPFGLDHTVTMGIVSAIGRANVGIVDYEDFIQTDAAINPGNSGGALINMRGELVGINTAIASESGGSQGIGFAIPSNMVKIVMASLVKTGKFVRGFLGVGIQTLTPEIAQSLNITVSQGVVISVVTEGSPAGRAGLRRYDIVLAVDGREVSSATELRNLIALRGPGSRVQLRVLREGRERTMTVTLGEAPAARQTEWPLLERNAASAGPGLSLEALGTTIRQEFAIPETVRRGVVVDSVESGGRAEKAGIRPGDVIVEVNRRETTTVSRFEELYRQADRRALVLAYRAGSMYLAVIEK